MFAFDRSAIAVLAPLALLLAVVLWSRFADVPAATQRLVEAEGAEDAGRDTDATQTVAANLPSR